MAVQKLLPSDLDGVAPGSHKRILVLTSSFRAGSSTERFGVLIAEELRQAGLDVDLVNVGDLHLPWCTGDPAQVDEPDVVAWRARVESAIGYVWVSAEWHGSVAGSFKNALDLLTVADMRWKVVALAAQAGGAMGAINALGHMRTVAQNLGAWALPVQLSVNASELKNQFKGDIVDRVQRLTTELDEAVSKFDRVM